MALGRGVECHIGRLGSLGRCRGSRLMAGQDLLRIGQFLVQPGGSPGQGLADDGQFLVLAQCLECSGGLLSRNRQRLGQPRQLHQLRLGPGQLAGRLVPGRSGRGGFLLRRTQYGARLAVFGRDRCESLFGSRQDRS